MYIAGKYQPNTSINKNHMLIKRNPIYLPCNIGDIVYNVYELLSYYEIEELIVTDVKYELKDDHITLYVKTPNSSSELFFELWRQDKTSFLLFDKDEAYSYDGKEYK